MRSFIIMAAIISVASCLASSSGTAQETSGNPALAAYTVYRLSEAEYRKCLADNPTDEHACDEQRHVMDANAQIWSEYPESRGDSYIGVPLGTFRR
jgi:hypothetical protein